MKEPEMAIPPLFMCPISLDLFKDPVTLCTGQTYDRSSIEKWLSCGNSTCPITMQTLHDLSIVPNHTLRHLIDQWIQLNCINGYNLKHHLVSKESTLDTKVEVLDKVHVLSQDLPLQNSFLIQLDFFQVILELAFENAYNLNFVEKSLVCGLKLLPFSDLESTLTCIFKEDESKFTNFLILFKNGTSFIKKSLCHIIVAISSSNEFLMTMFGKSKILVQELVHVIENNLDGYEESIKALSTLSCIEYNREFIVKENAIKGLITYIVNAPKCSYAPIILAMKTIETLLVVESANDNDNPVKSRTAVESAKEEILNHPNGINAIVKMVFRVSSKHHEGSESALNCLIILCQDSMHNAREEAICCGVLTQLLLLLQSQCNEMTKNKARMLLKLLRSMCNGDQK